MTLRRFSFIYSICLMCIFSALLIGYRYYFEYPQILQRIVMLQTRELHAVDIMIDQQLQQLAISNYDYAVWDESYEFIQYPTRAFITENFLDDTFTSLKIDGAIFVGKNKKIQWDRGFDYVEKRALSVEPLDVVTAEIVNITYPTSSQTDAVPQKMGFISTNYGPVMFASSQLRQSDRSGQQVGMLLFIRKVRLSLIHQLADFSQLSITQGDINAQQNIDHIPDISAPIGDAAFSLTRQRVIKDITGKAIIILNIRHINNDPPPFFNHTLQIILVVLITIPFILQWIVNLMFIRPITIGITNIVNMIYRGELTPLKGESNILEIQKLITSFNQLVNIVNQQKEDLEVLALKDALTGIANRRAFENHLSLSWSLTQRNALPLAIVMVDIDFFKHYNDNLGHQAGDAAIQQVATTLSQHLVRNDDMVARYGGEEFAIILINTDISHVQSMMSRLLLAVRHLAISHPGSSVSSHLTISLGAAVTTQFECTSVDELLLHADQALYQAKSAGRNNAMLWGS
ncbi:diguanylate cyclase [Shewanella sp. YLB-07]|nr:diguanylate cyclase [Shewanella sp. YLB-07]